MTAVIDDDDCYYNDENDGKYADTASVTGDDVKKAMPRSMASKDDVNGGDINDKNDVSDSDSDDNGDNYGRYT